MLGELKKKVPEANLLLPKYGLITPTWRNVPGIDREYGIIATKPSSVGYDDTSTGDIVLCGLEGNVVEGKLKPNSDLMTHLEFYKNFPNIGEAAHTYSRWVTVFARAGKAIPTLGTTQADYFYEDIPCTRQMSEVEIHGEYKLKTGHVIMETFRQKGVDPNSVPEVLAHNHGPFSRGKDPSKAVHDAAVMEECATMAFVSAMLQNGSVRPMQRVLLDKHSKRKHGPSVYCGQRGSS